LDTAFFLAMDILGTMVTVTDIGTDVITDVIIDVIIGDYMKDVKTTKYVTIYAVGL
jgi:hypothetical protein